jgi:hypothetical protein
MLAVGVDSENAAQMLALYSCVIPDRELCWRYNRWKMMVFERGGSLATTHVSPVNAKIRRLVPWPTLPLILAFADSYSHSQHEFIPSITSIIWR